MIIKQPCGIDCYSGNSFPNLSTYNPVIVFLKASEADFEDSAFVERMGIVKQNGIRRGCYHFFRKAYPVLIQAQTFINVCKKAGTNSQDVLVGDFEEEGLTESQLKLWLESVRLEFPDNLIFIYSRKLLLDAISVSDDYFRQYPVWVAGYPDNPDLFDSPPLAYIPDQTKWGVVWCWQYADTSIGLDWISTQFLEWLGEKPKEIQEFWFDGIVSYKEYWTKDTNDFYVHISRFKRSDVKRIYVNGLGFQGTGIYFFNSRDQPHIIINGGHADYSVSPPVPNAVVVTDGEIQKTDPHEDSIQFDKNHQPIGMEWFVNSKAWNTVGVSSVLLRNGQIPVSVRLQDFVGKIKSILPSVNDTYVDPRNALFWNEEEYILIDIDGRNNGTLGATQLELARLALLIGATDGGNLDGGTSNTLIYNYEGTPIIKNNPPDGKLHAVANHVGFWFDASTLPNNPDEGDGMSQRIVIKDTTYYRSPGSGGIDTARKGSIFTPVNTSGAYIQASANDPVKFAGKWLLSADTAPYEETPPIDPDPTPGEIPFQVSTGTTGYTAVIDSDGSTDGVVKGRFIPNA